MQDEIENVYRYEWLSDSITVCVSNEHRFGTDAFLLADFCNAKRRDRVCDLGTGCGIIPLAVLRNYSPSYILGVDIQEQAVLQFNEGIRLSSCGKVVKAVCADLKEIGGMVDKASFDVVTCNPPYKLNDTGIKSTLTAQMIARHEVLCTIDDVCKASAKLLRFGGKLCICQRPERLGDVIVAMKSAGIEPKRLRFVSKNPNSDPWLFLIEGKKGSNPYMKVEKGLYLYDDNGEYTDEMKGIYRM